MNTWGKDEIPERTEIIDFPEKMEITNVRKGTSGRSGTTCGGTGPPDLTEWKDGWMDDGWGEP